MNLGIAANGYNKEVVRETSKYNKYIKWFYRSYREDGTLAVSFGCKTKSEAEAWMTR